MVAQVSQALSVNTHLQSLDLTDCRIGNEGVLALAKPLRMNVTIDFLWERFSCVSSNFGLLLNIVESAIFERSYETNVESLQRIVPDMC